MCQCSMHKIKVYHFHNGTGGGVLSVIKNLLFYSDKKLFENHIIHTVNKAIVPGYSIELVEGAASQQLFYYSPNSNFYYTCRQLAKLLPEEKAIIVAHDWVELGMVSNLGLQNPVIQFVHGDYDYYYQLAAKHEAAIDVFVCVAVSIQQKLLKQLPGRKNDINYLRFPVAVSNCSNKISNGFNVVYAGRCTKEKGYHLLPLIAQMLKESGVTARWHIAGSADETLMNEYPWDVSIEIKFYGNIANENLLALLCAMDVMVLPSIAEGMPVSIIEAMKAGVVPVVNDLPGGIQELVLQNETGIKITGNDVAGFVTALKKLALDNAERQKLAANARERANELFDPDRNATAIEKLYLKGYENVPLKKKAVKVYGSRLDRPWLSNSIVKSFRLLSFYFNARLK